MVPGPRRSSDHTRVIFGGPREPAPRRQALEGAPKPLTVEGGGEDFRFIGGEDRKRAAEEFLLDRQANVEEIRAAVRERLKKPRSARKLAGR